MTRVTRQIIRSVISRLYKDVQSHFTKGMSSVHADRCNESIKQLFDYTLNDGKYARSLLAVHTYQSLKPLAAGDELQRVVKAASIIEVLQGFFLVMDDIVDQSQMRRGKPCWYRLPGVGLRANVDSLLLESSVDVLMRKVLHDHPQRNTILDNLVETKARTVMGQELDTMRTDPVDFNWQLYREIVERKTSHYTYFFPLLLGFQLADVSIGLTALRSVAYKLGHLFQAQDDYLDAFGASTVTGKSSSDFAESKCTWLTCALVERISNDSAKMAMFLQHFGRPDSSDIDAVRRIVVNAGVPDAFRRFQKTAVQELRAEIATFPIRDVRPLLASSVDTIIDRKK